MEILQRGRYQFKCCAPESNFAGYPVGYLVHLQINLLGNPLSIKLNLNYISSFVSWDPISSSEITEINKSIYVIFV